MIKKTKIGKLLEQVYYSTPGNSGNCQIVKTKEGHYEFQGEQVPEYFIGKKYKSKDEALTDYARYPLLPAHQPNPQFKH